MRIQILILGFKGLKVLLLPCALSAQIVLSYGIIYLLYLETCAVNTWNSGSGGSGSGGPGFNPRPSPCFLSQETSFPFVSLNPGI